MRKYIIYAFGEVFLVMIGILLALQVNNWNEDRKARNEEQSYLHSLREEFRDNLDKLTEVKNKNSSNIKNAIELSKFTGPDTPQLTEEKMGALLFGTVGSEVQYRPGSGVVDEIISSGKLDIFTNQDLKSSLASWNGILLRIRFQEQEHSNLRFKLLDMTEVHGNSRKAFAHFYGEGFGVTQSRFTESNLPLLQILEFDNYVTGFIATATFLNGRYTFLEENIEEILRLIEGNLN